MTRSEPITCLILTPGEIPTTDYYVTPRLRRWPVGLVQRLDSRRPLEAGFEMARSCVIIVRHARAAWLDFLLRHHNRLRGVAFLMDDDLPAAWRCQDVPLDYGLWTSARYWRIQRKLRELQAQWWVSTPELARRYAGALVVPPLPFDVGGTPAPAGCRRWGYHGTRIHHRELRWLVPIVEAVQRAVPDAEFEVFGDEKVARLFAHVPRVIVRPPLPWPEYVRYARATPLALGLAPLLPGHFNAARSHTKVFDILRCGAVGLFSDRTPYAEALAGSGAVLLPDDREQWIEWSVRLLQDDVLRQQIYQRIWRSATASVDGQTISSWLELPRKFLADAGSD